mmetsp:Transcript_25205/g.44951  ORF Transcript_25205/g.44951 Transcript_25205/m.44951 type:complete len:219 (-) Transcript_25205:440-1096(-)
MRAVLPTRFPHLFCEQSRSTRQATPAKTSFNGQPQAGTPGSRWKVSRFLRTCRTSVVASASGADDRGPSSGTPQTPNSCEGPPTKAPKDSLTTDSATQEDNYTGDTPGVRQKLAHYGLAGVIAYGLLNTIYYVCAFVFFVNAVQVPKGMGIAATCKKLLEAFVLTWAGSQVTKLPRLAGAAALAPFVNRLLNYIEKNTFVRVSRNQVRPAAPIRAVHL